MVHMVTYFLRFSYINMSHLKKITLNIKKNITNNSLNWQRKRYTKVSKAWLGSKFTIFSLTFLFDIYKSGAYFMNILRAAFTLVGTISVKWHCWLDVFLRFWDLRVKKLLVEHWWNWPLTLRGSFISTFLNIYISRSRVFATYVQTNFITHLEIQKSTFSFICKALNICTLYQQIN